MKKLKDILKHCSKKAFTPTGTEDDKLFKAKNIKAAQIDDPHGHKHPQDEKAYRDAQKHDRSGMTTGEPRRVDPFSPPSPKNAVFEKIDHAQTYAKTQGDVSVAKYKVSKDGKRVGVVKHTTKGDEHQKIAFFPLGARKAKAFNAMAIPGSSNKEKIAHIIKMHVKEEVSLEDVVERYVIEKFSEGEKIAAHDPRGYQKRLPKMKKIGPKIPKV